MSYRTCAKCGRTDYCNSEGYCRDCELYRQASGYGASQVKYGTCTKCGRPKFDCNSSGICGDCRRYYGL